MKKNMKISLGMFDFAKGIAVLGVILFHMRSRYTVEQVPLLLPFYLVLLILGSGLMPMFFIISGYSFKPKSADVMLKKTFSGMIVPYLWSIPIILVLFLLMQYPFFYPKQALWDRFLSHLGGLLLGLPESTTILGFELWAIVTMWFFWALFIAQNLLNQIVKVSKASLQILLVAACVVGGYVLRQLGFLYFCIPQGMMAVGFCYAGYAMKKWKLVDRWMYSPWSYVCLLPVYAAQIVLGGLEGFNMASGEYSLFGYFSAGCGGVLLLFAALWCNRFEGRVVEGIRKIGTLSFWIIYTHGIELLAVPWEKITVENPNPYLALLIEVGLKIIIAVMGCMVFKKISQMNYRRKTVQKV